MIAQVHPSNIDNADSSEYSDDSRSLSDMDLETEEEEPSANFKRSCTPSELPVDTQHVTSSTKENVLGIPVENYPGALNRRIESGLTLEKDGVSIPMVAHEQAQSPYDDMQHIDKTIDNEGKINSQSCTLSKSQCTQDVQPHDDAIKLILKEKVAGAREKLEEKASDSPDILQMTTSNADAGRGQDLETNVEEDIEESGCDTPKSDTTINENIGTDWDVNVTKSLGAGDYSRVDFNLNGKSVTEKIDSVKSSSSQDKNLSFSGTHSFCGTRDVSTEDTVEVCGLELKTVQSQDSDSGLADIPPLKHNKEKESQKDRMWQAKPSSEYYPGVHFDPPKKVESTRRGLLPTPAGRLSTSTNFQGAALLPTPTMLPTPTILPLPTILPSPKNLPSPGTGLLPTPNIPPTQPPGLKARVSPHNLPVRPQSTGITTSQNSCAMALRHTEVISIFYFITVTIYLITYSSVITK